MPAIFLSQKPPTNMIGVKLEPTISNLKRSRAFQDDNTAEVLSMSKRPRVSFDEQVEVKKSDELPEKSLALVQAEIRHAIKSQSEGDFENYDKIREYFDTPEDHGETASDVLLRTYILGLANNAALMKRSCSDLVHAVLRFSWLAQDDIFVNVYFHFLRQIVSLQSGYTSEILKMLIQNFAHLSSSTGELHQHTLLRRLELQARVHTAIQQVLRLQPSAITVLSGLLQSNFPFRTETKKAHVEYVRNILKVIEYAPELRPIILDIIIDKLVTIDVQVQVDVEELEYDVEDSLLQSGYSQDSLTDTTYVNEGSDIESVVSDDDEGSEEKRTRILKSSVEKMDAILDILFAYLHPYFDKDSNLSGSRSIFSQLLSQFRSIILPTYRSRHTQFLLFHFAQTSSEHALLFVDACIAAMSDKSYATILRTSAAAYLASFTARAASLTSHDIDHIFRSLSSYLDKLRTEFEPTMVNSQRHSISSLSRHSIYYATFQALIYIFCFRWRDLLIDPDDHVDDDVADLVSEGRELDWAPGVREIFQRNVFSKLNPLKLCAPEIVEEFARITHYFRFMYVYQLIDKNRRLRLGQRIVVGSMATRETSLTARQGDRPHQLDAYFPFDPYRLPVSKRWLAGDYNEWRGVPGLHNNVMVDNEEQDEEEVSNATDEKRENEATKN